MTVTEMLRQEKLKKLIRSNHGAEAAQKSLHRKSEFAKNVLKGHAQNVPEYRARTEYYKRLNAYRNRYKPETYTDSKRVLALWKRVVKAIDKSEVPLDKYMAAQFAYFDETFGTTPKIYQLATEAAIERAREYVGTTKKRVERYSKSASTADVMREADKQVRAMMKAQKVDRVTFYKRFVLTGVVQLPKQFLDRDPAYRKAKEST